MAWFSGLSIAADTTRIGRPMTISSVREMSCTVAAMGGRGVSTNPGGGTQVCAAVLTILVPIMWANRLKVVFRKRLIFRSSYITTVGIYIQRVSAVKSSHSGATRFHRARYGDSVADDTRRAMDYHVENEARPLAHQAGERPSSRSPPRGRGQNHAPIQDRARHARRERPGDRRVVYIKLTAPGIRLAERLRATQIETCRAMLVGLPVRDRDELIRLVAQV